MTGPPLFTVVAGASLPGEYSPRSGIALENPAVPSPTGSFGRADRMEFCYSPSGHSGDPLEIAAFKPEILSGLSSTRSNSFVRVLSCSGESARFYKLLLFLHCLCLIFL
jgi:hypothetical protein